MNQEWLQFTFDPGLLPGVDTYADLTDHILHDYRSSETEESRQGITVEKLDKLVYDELHINMPDKDARSRMKALFVSCLSLLHWNRVKWLTNENKAIAFRQVLSAVCTVSLQSQLWSCLSFTHHWLEKTLKGFMAHAINLSVAYQLVDNGPFVRKNIETISWRNKRNLPALGGDSSTNEQTKNFGKVRP